MVVVEALEPSEEADPQQPEGTAAPEFHHPSPDQLSLEAEVEAVASTPPERPAQVAQVVEATEPQAPAHRPQELPTQAEAAADQAPTPSTEATEVQEQCSSNTHPPAQQQSAPD